MKRLIKSLIRSFVYWRLARLPLSEAGALRWAERLKRWPAIFADEPFLVRRWLENGFFMRLGLIDVIERTLFLQGTWDVHVASLMSKAITGGQTVVDVGANIGYFTLLASKLVGKSGIVVAIEPSQRNLARLCDHLWSNDAENVLVLSVAAGQGVAIPAIAFPTYNNAGAATLRPIPSIKSQRTFQLALDDVFEHYSLSPDFIKLDVEGFELEALKGMELMLRRCHPVVVCELTPRFLSELGQTSLELIAFMESLGYTCAVVSNGFTLQKTRYISSYDSELPADQVDVVFRVPVALS